MAKEDEETTQENPSDRTAQYAIVSPFDAISKSKLGDKRYADCYKWPNINQEESLSMKMLLILFNARGCHHPGSYADADSDSVAFGQKTLNVMGPFL